MEENQRKFKQSHYWERLRNAVRSQNIDWSKSSLFEQYKNHGRFKECEEGVYNETELDYYITVLKKMNGQQYKEDVGYSNELVQLHHKKALNTLKFLMKQVNNEFYFERILLRYSDKTVDTVIKLLVRGKKMYEAIDNVLLIFSVIQKRDVSIVLLTMFRKLQKPPQIMVMLLVDSITGFSI